MGEPSGGGRYSDNAQHGPVLTSGWCVDQDAAEGALIVIWAPSAIAVSRLEETQIGGGRHHLATWGCLLNLRNLRQVESDRESCDASRADQVRFPLHHVDCSQPH